MGHSVIFKINGNEVTGLEYDNFLIERRLHIKHNPPAFIITADQLHALMFGDDIEPMLIKYLRIQYDLELIPQIKRSVKTYEEICDANDDDMGSPSDVQVANNYTKNCEDFYSKIEKNQKTLENIFLQLVTIDSSSSSSNIVLDSNSESDSNVAENYILPPMLLDNTMMKVEITELVNCLEQLKLKFFQNYYGSLLRFKRYCEDNNPLNSLRTIIKKRLQKLADRRIMIDNQLATKEELLSNLMSTMDGPDDEYHPRLTKYGRVIDHIDAGQFYSELCCILGTHVLFSQLTDSVHPDELKKIKSLNLQQYFVPFEDYFLIVCFPKVKLNSVKDFLLFLDDLRVMGVIKNVPVVLEQYYEFDQILEVSLRESNVLFLKNRILIEKSGLIKKYEEVHYKNGPQEQASINQEANVDIVLANLTIRDLHHQKLDVVLEETSINEILEEVEWELSIFGAHRTTATQKINNFFGIDIEKPPEPVNNMLSLDDQLNREEDQLREKVMHLKRNSFQMEAASKVTGTTRKKKVPAAIEFSMEDVNNTKQMLQQEELSKFIDKEAINEFTHNYKWRNQMRKFLKLGVKDAALTLEEFKEELKAAIRDKQEIFQPFMTHCSDNLNKIMNVSDSIILRLVWDNSLHAVKLKAQLNENATRLWDIKNLNIFQRYLCALSFLFEIAKFNKCSTVIIPNMDTWFPTKGKELSAGLTGNLVESPDLPANRKDLLNQLAKNIHPDYLNNGGCMNGTDYFKQIIFLTNDEEFESHEHYIWSFQQPSPASLMEGGIYTHMFNREKPPQPPGQC